MKKYVCLAHRFPAAGIDGVLGVPVQSPSEIKEYADAIGEPSNANIRFVRLTSIPSQSEHLFSVGDVVVKYAGLSERFLDILRPVETAYMLSKYKAGEIDWDHAESVRQAAMEEDGWRLATDGWQVAICDPAGRLAVLRGNHGLPRRLFSTAYTVLQQTESDRRKVAPDEFKERRTSVSDKMRCAWGTFRFIHHWIFKHGPVVDSNLLHGLKKKIKKHNRAYSRIPKPEFGELLRLHTRRTHIHSQDFWKRAKVEYLEDPDSIHHILSFIASKRSVRWVRLTMKEAEEVLFYVDWDEWKEDRDPMHFSPLSAAKGDTSAWN